MFSFEELQVVGYEDIQVVIGCGLLSLCPARSAGIVGNFSRGTDCHKYEITYAMNANDQVV